MNFDTRVRDDAAAGKLEAPRILAANMGISVPGGHMAGSVAIAANSIPEALAQVETARLQGVDLVKLMITGGVLDAKEKGTPGELKMEPDMVRAVWRQGARVGLYCCCACRVNRRRACGARVWRRLDRARRCSDGRSDAPVQGGKFLPVHYAFSCASVCAVRSLRLLCKRGRAV